MPIGPGESMECLSALAALGPVAQTCTPIARDILNRHHQGMPLLICALPETVAGATSQSEYQHYCFCPGGIMPLARSVKDRVSGAGALLPLSSTASHSPAQSLVPLTVPTSLQPIGSLGFT